MKFSKSTFSAIIRRFDLTGDGKISFNEFVEVISPSFVKPEYIKPPKIQTYSPRKSAIKEQSSPTIQKSYQKDKTGILIDKENIRTQRKSAKNLKHNKSLDVAK